MLLDRNEQFDFLYNFECSSKHFPNINKLSFCFQLPVGESISNTWNETPLPRERPHCLVRLSQHDLPSPQRRGQPCSWSTVREVPCARLPDYILLNNIIKLQALRIRQASREHRFIWWEIWWFAWIVLHLPLSLWHYDVIDSWIGRENTNHQ